MRLIKHIYNRSLRDADRSIALLCSSRLTKHKRIGFLRSIKQKIAPASSSRLVRHNRPSRVRNISRKIASVGFAGVIMRFCKMCLQHISQKVALTRSKRLVRHNLTNSSASGSRKLTVVVASMMMGGGALVVAQADESLTEFTRRAYVGIGGGGSFLEPRTPNQSLTVSSNSSAGFHIVGGYDFTSRISAELYYADLGAAEIAFMGSDVGDINYQVFGLSAIGYIYNTRSGFQPRSQSSGMGTREGLSLFSRVGVGGLTADSDIDYKVNHSTHLALGLGAEYGFKNGFAVRGEYRALDTDQHYGTVSLVKRFGKVRSVLPAAAAALPAVSTPEVNTPDVVIPEINTAEINSAEVLAPDANVFTTPKTASFTGSESVNFDLDKSNISQAAANKLNEIAAVLGSTDDNIIVEGHTCWIASERYNYHLSIRRAESVRGYLESLGIGRERISIRGFGETRPVALNDTAEGRAQNRRVDIRIN